VVAARRVAMDTCVPCSKLVAQGSLLALEPTPTLSGTIPSSSVGDEFKALFVLKMFCELSPRVLEVYSK